MDEQNTQVPSEQQASYASARQAAYERAYYQAASSVPWAADQLKDRDNAEGGQAGAAEGQAAQDAQRSQGAQDAQDAQGAAASASQDAPSFVDYVASDAFQQAAQRAQGGAQGQSAQNAQQANQRPQQQQSGQRPQQPFVDNAYQQPWNPSSDPYGQSSAAQGGSGYEHTYAYRQAYNQAVYGNATAGRQQRQQPYTPYVASKDHVAAGLLAIFLGSLGIHKFYLGYNTAGFIMLGVTILGSLFTFGLAGGVMGVISLVEGIIYLTKNQGTFDAEYVYSRKEWF